MFVSGMGLDGPVVVKATDGRRLAGGLGQSLLNLFPDCAIPRQLA